MKQLSVEERGRMRDDVQARTIEDADRLLKDGNKVCIIRPTGFGKTYSSIKYGCENGYDTIVFISPLRAINQMIENSDVYQDMLKKSKTFLLTYCYQGIAIAYSRGLENMNKYLEYVEDSPRTLVILDECHRACSNKTFRAVKEGLMEQVLPRCKYIGMTATPERNLDDRNPLVDLFDGIQTFPYALNNALNDGIFLKPVYVKADNFITSDSIAEFVEEQKKILALPNSHMRVLQNRILRASTLNIEDNLRKYLIPSVEGRNYLKIVIFFRYISMINPKSKNDKSTEYVELFKKMFPDYKVNAFRIHSLDDSDALDDVYASKNDGTNKIDLIFSVDKLNMGYHEDDMNIIIMNRPTQSDPLYIQELGRPFSSKSIYSPLIFDFVGNHLLMFETNENKVFRAGGRSKTKIGGASLGTAGEVEESMFNIFGSGNVDVFVSEMDNIMDNERIWAYENKHKYNECMMFFNEEIDDEYKDERLHFCATELNLTEDDFIEEYNAWVEEG